jgi:hypothetical protein
MQKRVLFTMSCMLIFQIVDKVLNSLDFGFVFFGLNYFYFDAFVVEVVTQFLLTIITLHDFHMSSSSCFLSYDLGHWVKPKSIMQFS